MSDKSKVPDIIFPRKLRMFRESIGFSQECLADMIKRENKGTIYASMTARTISNYENGRYAPKPEDIEVIAKALRVSKFDLCPVYFMIPFKEMLSERIRIEVNGAGLFCEHASSSEKEDLEKIGDDYMNADEQKRLYLDPLIHQSILKVGGRTDMRTYKMSRYTVITDFFSQLNRIADTSGYFLPEKQDILLADHKAIIGAALNGRISNLKDALVNNINFVNNLNI